MIFPKNSNLCLISKFCPSYPTQRPVAYNLEAIQAPIIISIQAIGKTIKAVLHSPKPVLTVAIQKIPNVAAHVTVADIKTDLK